MKKILIFSFLGSLLFAEPSAFLAGDLDSANPYGLTKDEKYILKNKKELQRLNNLIDKQQALIKSQNKEIQNLKLLILNINTKMENYNQKLNGIQSVLSSVDEIYIQIPTLKNDIKKLNKFLMDYKNKFTLFQTSVKENFHNLKDVVNKNKITNDKNTKIVINLVEKMAQSLEKLDIEFKIQKNKLDFRSWSKQEIFEKALTNFKNAEFIRANRKLLYLYKVNYKLGTVSFYLGEMEYKKSNYKRALRYYKKSMLNSGKSAYYMDDLLYHTGYSLEKDGKIKSAKNSYLKLIHDYPKSMFVEYAKKRLDNLEKTK